jgi:oligopeptide/dipeptide ABC transporter ATP-binding protein
VSEELIAVAGLKKHFPIRGRLFRGARDAVVCAVDGISFPIHRGETVALVGESGCGKTTTANLILGLEKPTAGGVLWQGQALDALDPAAFREYRRSVQAVFQDPQNSMNPRMRVGAYIQEPLLVNRLGNARERREAVDAMLADVGLRKEDAGLFPHQFSGGERQRIAIARALVLNPKLIVLDEPVSALDVSIRAQILNLLKDLQQRLGLSYLLIAHHLAAVRYISHRVAVMYLGVIVETGNSENVFSGPLHPYTKALISAALPAHPDVRRAQIILSGEVPSPIHIPRGCRFHPRCPVAMPDCATTEPALRAVSGNRHVACHYVG